MAFRPASSPKRVKCGSPAAYYISNSRTGYPYLTIRITRHLANSLGVKKGDAVRLDVGTDRDKGLVRLTPVLRANQHWGGKGESNQSLYTGRAWSGDIEAAFPMAERITPLEVVDISRESGLTLKLKTTNS